MKLVNVLIHVNVNNKTLRTKSFLGNEILKN